ncbi:hypothetical protein [Pontibacillus salipaludis]|uniref:hypothetical protein n=1 Tax=Pontibacillus salipaludis TaxID=1697394 RepID=UPI0031F1610D
MCYVEIVDSALKELEAEYSVLTSELSAADIAISDYYHRLEFGDEKIGFFNSKTRLKELKELLTKRRIIKEELAQVGSMKANLKDRSARADEARKQRLGN